jgi:hypothetical protein
MKATAKAPANHKELRSMLPADGGTVKRYWRGSPTLVSTSISGYAASRERSQVIRPILGRIDVDVSDQFQGRRAYQSRRFVHPLGD